MTTMQTTIRPQALAAGRSLEDETKQAYDALELGAARSRVKVYGFATDFYRYSGAADVVVGRGGMGSLTEFALQHKACVVVPSKQLGWNVKNSHALAEQGAIVELTEEQAEQPERFGRTLATLLEDGATQKILGERLSGIARPTAAHDLAAMLIEIGKRK
jgi:UDP-N-acetylglucosamine:LPS N-acetylglucosamine transferase